MYPKTYRMCRKKTQYMHKLFSDSLVYLIAAKSVTVYRVTFPPELKLSVLDFCKKYCPILSTFGKVTAEIKRFILWFTV